MISYSKEARSITINSGLLIEKFNDATHRPSHYSYDYPLAIMFDYIKTILHCKVDHFSVIHDSFTIVFSDPESIIVISLLYGDNQDALNSDILSHHRIYCDN